MWGETCTRFCSLPCLDLSGLGVEVDPVCYERDGSCGINAGCQSEGCRCDLDSMKEAYNLDEPDFQGVHFKCNNETMGVIIDKCVLNKFGYQLEDLAIVGYSENSELASSAENTCRGKLNYEFESSYIFEVKGHTDCNTDIIDNGSSLTYKSRIYGYKETAYDQLTIEDELVVIDFECTVEK